MRPFMDQNFLLSSDTAKTLYHEYAREMPIIDYHCHLSPKEIAENKSYRNMTELWLGGDHYKWRAMRSNGVDEQYITGQGDDREKFQKWAETMPHCIGNPLFHWTHLELRRYFGIHDILSPATAETIWNKCNEKLQNEEFTARGFILRSNVKMICTTDDPTDTLEYHIQLANDDTFPVKVLPAFRPDKVINLEREGFREWVERLGAVTGSSIESYEALKTALRSRIAFFHQVGCRLSDHALDPVVYQDATEQEMAEIFKKAIRAISITPKEIHQYKTGIMQFLGREYAKHQWVMQLHMGTIRNINRRMMKILGPDTGFDTIGDESIALPLSKMLNRLDETGELPKTILYCLNPRDNDVLGTMIGCFQGDSIPGKLQFGSGWWFNDQKDGIIRQMTALANHGLLGRFVGMLTDSRNFLSYTRHEYFRRILCNLIGGWVENGEYPADMKALGELVQNICYWNAKAYFVG